MGPRLLLDRRPVIHETAYVAPSAVLLGDVHIEADASVWFNCVLRGDVNTIRVGQRSNVQDLSLCHGLLDRNPVIIGDDVTIGHCAIIHGCVVEDRCLIGMGAKVLSGAVIGEESIVAAGAVVREGQIIPPRSLVVGLPAKVKKTLTDDELKLVRRYGTNYLAYKDIYLEQAEDIAALLKDLDG
jgi:carbonic anhydrase/acetyltransferase-like protein (isoleucine patch superfamily)